tara:strand:+ start:2070 stop:2435 length:366 start_codon:yes stop_codon:yes gene_type:complete
MKKSKKASGSKLAKETILRSASKLPMKKNERTIVRRKHFKELAKAQSKKPETKTTKARKSVGRRSSLSRGKRRSSFILRSNSYNEAVAKRNQKDANRYNSIVSQDVRISNNSKFNNRSYNN